MEKTLCEGLKLDSWHPSMPKDTPVQEFLRSSSELYGQYSDSRCRNHHSLTLEYLSLEEEAIRTTALSNGDQVTETRSLQIKGKRKRAEEAYDEDEDDCDVSTDYTSDEDEVCVMMQVTKRERREILQHRENQELSNKRRRTLADSAESEQNDSPRANISGPSMFAFASEFSVDGDMSSVAGDQTIVVKQQNYRRPSPEIGIPILSNNPYREDIIKAKEDQNKIADSTPPRLLTPSLQQKYDSYSPTRERRRAPMNLHSAKTSVSGPSVLAFATNFVIGESDLHPGAFSAVQGNQTITILGDDSDY